MKWKRHNDRFTVNAAKRVVFAAAAASSWWCGLDRDQLIQQASRELPRMQQSKFGRLVKAFDKEISE